MFVVNVIEILNKFCMALQRVKSRIIESVLKNPIVVSMNLYYVKP